MRLMKVFVRGTVLLTLTAGCTGKSDDQKSFDLILENTPNMKLVHLPNAEVTSMLAGKGIKLNGAGCPMKFTRVPGAFYESDGSILPACVPSFTNTAMPYEIDYLRTGEKTPLPDEALAH